MGRRLVATALLIGVALGAWAAEVPVLPTEGFENSQAAAEAAGWDFGPGCSVEAGVEGSFVRCGPVEADRASAVRLMGIKVKPRTGYIARYRMRSDGAAHHTFGLVNANGVFLVCKDAYATGQWGECALAFRTGEQTEIGLYLGRRYGTGAILYDDVSLVEDDSVRVGDLSPAPNPPPAPTAAEARRGYLVSSQHWMELVYPTCQPLRVEIVNGLRCRLAPGEYEPVTLSLTALRPLRNARVTVASDLRGPGGARQPASAVQVGVVRSITRWLNNSEPLKAGQSYERRPLFIFPGDVSDIVAGETQRYWLTVHAPPDARPGVYRTRLRVSPDGAPATTLPLTVEVLPLRLPEPDVTYGMYYRQCCQYPEFRTEEFFRRSMMDMRAHGCNSVSVYANVERRLPDGTFAPDFDLEGPGHGIGEEHMALNRQMALLREAGLLREGHPLLFLACGRSNGVFANEERLVRAVEARRRAQGWPELLYYLVDEPAPDQRELIHELADVVHRVPGVRSTTAIGEPGELGQYYDVWILSDGVDPMERTVAQARAAGKEAWTYNCNWNGCQPRNDRYFTGYFTWTAGLTGNWQWCYTEATGGRVTADGSLDFGDVTYYEDPHRYSYVLPTPTGNVPTLGWEGRREGIDDYRYLQAVRDAAEVAARSPAPERRALAREARSFLREVRRLTRRPQQHLPATQTARVYEHLVHPDLAPADYDAIRARAAEYAVRLQASDL